MKGSVALAGAVLLLLVTAAPALPAVKDGSFALVDRPTGFGPLPFDGVSTAFVSPHAISADGCFVVFTSDNDILFAGDDDDVFNIYRLDRCSPGHPLTLVSASASGTPGHGDSFNPSISASGRHVAFFTQATNLHPEATPRGSVLVKDMNQGGVELATRGDGVAGGVAGDQLGPVVISGNGRVVAFNAQGPLHAANGDAAAASQSNAFVRFLDTGHTFLLSVANGNATGATNAMGLSFDGKSAAFATDAQLVAGDQDTNVDAYLARSIDTGMTVQLASLNVGASSKSTNTSSGAALSSDGQRVAWANAHVWQTTCAPTCMPASGQLDPSIGDGNTNANVEFGHSVNGATPIPPTHVFWTTDAQLKPDDLNFGNDVYGHALNDLSANGLSLLTTGTVAGGVVGGGVTDSGGVIGFSASSMSLPGTDGAHDQAFVRSGGQTTLISQPEGSAPRRSEVDSSFVQPLHAVSADGTRVAFATLAPFLGAPLDRRFRVGQSFVRDVDTGATIPVSQAPDGTPANQGARRPSIDAAGTRVVFTSRATNLVPGVPPNVEHVYLRDLSAKTTRLLDRGPDGKPVPDDASAAVIGADGRHVVFLSASKDLDGGDGMKRHVFEFDTATGKFTLVDKTADGAIANGNASEADVSADGRRVAFTTNATNLDGGATGTDQDAYVKDLVTGELVWASRPQDGSKNHSNVFDIALSGNGRVVAFGNAKLGFGFGADAQQHVFVHDVDAGTTRSVSAGALGPGGFEGVASIDASGSRVVFTAIPAGRTGAEQLVRDLGAPAPISILPPSGVLFFTASLNASGKCVAIGSDTKNLVSPSFGSDYAHVHLRAIGGDCPPAPGTPEAAAIPMPVASSDMTAPVLSRVSMTNRRFALAAGRTAATAKAKRGTTFRFTLSEAAVTKIAIARRQGKRKVRFVPVLALTRTKTAAGRNRVRFTGRVGKRKLRPGRYRATLTATDAAVNTSRPRTISFTMLRRR
jgi:Tol biopolymer transport system component